MLACERGIRNLLKSRKLPQTIVFRRHTLRDNYKRITRKIFSRKQSECGRSQRRNGAPKRPGSPPHLGRKNELDECLHRPGGILSEDIQMMEVRSDRSLLFDHSGGCAFTGKKKCFGVRPLPCPGSVGETCPWCVFQRMLSSCVKSRENASDSLRISPNAQSRGSFLNVVVARSNSVRIKKEAIKIYKKRQEEIVGKVEMKMKEIKENIENCNGSLNKFSLYFYKIKTLLKI